MTNYHLLMSKTKSDYDKITSLRHHNGNKLKNYFISFCYQIMDL